MICLSCDYVRQRGNTRYMAVYARGLDLVREVRKGTLSPCNGLGMTERGGDRARRGQCHGRRKVLQKAFGRNKH